MREYGAGIGRVGLLEGVWGRDRESGFTGLLEGVWGRDREGGFTRGSTGQGQGGGVYPREYGAGIGRMGLPEGVRGRDREGGFT